MSYALGDCKHCGNIPGFDGDCTGCACFDCIFNTDCDCQCSWPDDQLEEEIKKRGRLNHGLDDHP